MKKIAAAVLIALSAGLYSLVSSAGPNCGTGFISFDEQCDDGNTTDGDGCSAVCGVEDGWDCAPINPGHINEGPTVCAPVCGDGLIVGDEGCDDGNTASGDGCSAACDVETPTDCGNGTVEAGEACDDGNAVNTDACTNACENAVCGDGILRTGTEECDDGNVADGDGCDAACQVQASGTTGGATTGGTTGGTGGDAGGGCSLIRNAVLD